MGFFITVLFDLTFYLGRHLIATLNTISYKCLTDTKQTVDEDKFFGAILADLLIGKLCFTTSNFLL